MTGSIGRQLHTHQQRRSSLSVHACLWSLRRSRLRTSLKIWLLTNRFLLPSSNV
jgi:hypothetical protein